MYPRRYPGPGFPLLHLAALLGQAVIAAFLLLHVAACGRPEAAPVADAVDSSDTRTRDIYQLTSGTDSLDRFAAALKATGLDEKLSGYGPWTAFVPSDRAFAENADLVDTMFRASLVDSLRKLLKYHIVRGRIDTSDVRQSRGDSLRLSTMVDRPLTMRFWKDNVLTVAGKRSRAHVLKEIETQNGIIYVISNVLMLPPPDTSASRGLVFF
ncbi:MAG TPA: fasciclin domain-containing protein [Rhodothermales bacterium]|nr:fasciclin domain-containing protein [Rhodothermales bacterium]